MEKIMDKLLDVLEKIKMTDIPEQKKIAIAKKLIADDLKARINNLKGVVHER